MHFHVCFPTFFVLPFLILYCSWAHSDNYVRSISTFILVYPNRMPQYCLSNQRTLSHMSSYFVPPSAPSRYSPRTDVPQDPFRQGNP